jgi:hypothetical protein
VVLAVCVASLALCAWPAIAETYEVSHRPVLEAIRPGGSEAIRPLVVVGTNGSEASGAYYLAVSDGGNADSYVSVSRGGCAGYRDYRGWYDVVAVAVGESGRTCESGAYDSSSYFGLGLLGADPHGYTAVSDTGDAKGTWVVTGTGACTQSHPVSATNENSGSDTEGGCVSGTGSSQSDRTLAVSGTGDASATTHCYWYQGQYLCHAPVAASGTGNSHGGVVAVAPGGSADGGGLLSVGVRSSSTSPGAVACISATGNCYGGARLGLAPLGTSN